MVNYALIEYFEKELDAFCKENAEILALGSKSEKAVQLNQEIFTRQERIKGMKQEYESLKRI